MEGEITIKLKLSNEGTFEIKIDPKATLLQFKEKIAQEKSCETGHIKLIYKGRWLKNDEETIEHNKVIDGNTMHIIINKPNESDGTSQSANTNSSTSSTNAPNTSSQVPTNLNAGQGQNPFAALGGMGGLGGLGGFGGLGGLGAGQLDPNDLSQALNSPQVQQMMQQMLSNPQALQQMLQQNPYTRQMIEQNPQILQMLQDPMMMQMLTNPQMIQQTMQMMQGGQGGLGGGLGGLGGLGAFGGLGGLGQQQPGQQQPQQQQPGQQQPGQQQPPFNLANMLNNPMFAGLGGMGGLGGFGFPPAQQDNTPPEEKYKEQLAQLEAMGFTNKSVNIDALKATGGNVEAAIERILNMLG